MNTNKIATGSVNKKLLAALAVLAVAFVVLAAVPAVATDSDAAATSLTAPTVTFDDSGKVTSIPTSELSNGIWTLTKNTVLTLSADVEIKGLVMGSHSLTITSSTTDAKTLTIRNDAVGTMSAPVYLLSTSAADLLKIDNANLVIDDQADKMLGYDTPSTGANRINLYAGTYIDADDAEITITSASTGHKLTNSASNIFDLKDSKLTITSASGVPGAKYFKIADSQLSVTGATNNSTDLSAYYEVSGKSTVDVGKTLVYSADVEGTSTFNASEADVYGGSASLKDIWTGAPTNIALKQIYVGTGSSVSADKWTKFSSGTGMSFNGKGTVSGTVAADYEVAANSTLTASDLTVADGATLTLNSNVTVSGSIAVNDGGYLYTGDNGKITLKSGSTLSLEADGASKTPAVKPVVLTANADSELTSTFAGVLTMKSGNVELTSGKLVIPADGSMTMTRGTFTVAQGAVLDAAASTSGLTVSAGTFNVNGELLFQKLTAAQDTSVVLGASSVTKYTGGTVAATTGSAAGINLGGTGSAVAKLTQTSGAKFAVLKDVTISGVTGLTTTTMYTVTGGVQSGYKLYVDGLEFVAEAKDYVLSGETVSVDAIAEQGSVVSAVTYKQTDGEDSAVAVPLALSGSYTYSVTAPAEDITVTASTVGALSVVFYLVYDDNTTIEEYKVYSGLKADSTITVPADPVKDGYRFVAWYDNQACSGDAVTSFTFDGSNPVNLIYYAKMISVNKVTTSYTGTGTVLATPSTPVYNGLVTITATPASGFVLDSLTVDGKAVKVDKTWQVSSNAISQTSTAYDKYTGAAFTYYFYMPDHDVAVSAVFKELYDATYTNPTAQGTITGIALGDGEASTTGVKALEGDTVKVTVTPTGNYAVADVTVTGGDGTVLKLSTGGVQKVTTGSGNSAKTTYNFEMPGEDVVVTATYNTKVILSFTGDANGTVTILGTTTSGTDTATVDAAIGTPFIITMTPVNADYGVKTLEIGTTDVKLSDIEIDDGVGTYSYTVPSSTTAGSTVTIAAAFGETFEIAVVTQSATGNVDYDTDDVAGVEGSTFDFTVRSPNDVMLNKIVVSEYTAASGNTQASTDPKETWIVNGTPASGQTATSAFWTVSGDVYTFKMPNYDVQIDFVFGDAVYYPITVSEGSEVAIYSDKALTTEVPDLSKTLKGTYYIVVKQKQGYDVDNASAKYTTTGGPVTSATGVTPVTYTYTAGEAVPLTRISLSAEQGVYSFDLKWDTTITAGYKAHTSTVSITQPVNGKITVTVNGTEIESGDPVDYDSVLTITATADDGYSVTGVTVNGAPYSESTYTVKMDNVAIGAATARAYAITATGDDGVTVTPSKTSAAADESIVLTIETKTGYSLSSLTVSGQAVTVTGSTYTFTMPAAAVAVVATSAEDSPAADNVTVSFVNMNGVTKVQVAAIDGYIPAGKVTITAWYSFTLAGRTVADSFTFDVVIIGGEGKYVEIADITTDNEHAATLFGGSAHYVATAGDVNSYDSPMTTITLAAAEA